MMERYKRLKKENKRTIFGLSTDNMVINENCGQVELNPILATDSFGPPPRNVTNVPVVTKVVSYINIPSNLDQPLSLM
jgi:hypothetical protein